MNDSIPDPTAQPGPDPMAQPTPDPDPALDPADEGAYEGADDIADDIADDSVTDAAPAAPDGDASIRSQNRVAAVAAIGLAVVLAFGGGFAVGRGTAPEAGLDPVATAASPDPASPAPSGVATLPSDGARLGRADAKVVIDYWADYQCPYCSTFAEETIPLLTSRIADGTVALVHRDFAFIGAESEAAAIAVRCAAREDRYWEMHDAVYAAQQGENQGAFARERLLQIGAAVGLDAASFEACLDERPQLVDVLDDTAAGVRAGIQSTPTVDVNGTRFLGVPDPARFLALIDEAAAGASPAPLPSAAPSPDPWSGTATDGRTAGAAVAPVLVELWMDYQSTDARAVAETLGPELRTRLDAGSIRAELRDVAALGEESVVAAAFVRCVAAQDGPAWFASDVLAVSGKGANSGIYTQENLLRLASKLGLDVRAMEACLVDPAVAAAVRTETGQATDAAVTAGPTIIIRKGAEEIGRFAAPLDVAAVVAAIDAAK